MKKTLPSLLLAALALGPLAAGACEFHKEVKVSGAYLKKTPPGATVGAAFLKITNEGDEAVNLISASSDLAGNAELHTHLKKEGKMAMVKLDKIPIKPHSSLSLAPGGLHIMLFDLKAPIDDKTTAALTLFFDNNKSIILKDVRAR